MENDLKSRKWTKFPIILENFKKYKIKFILN